MAYRLDKHDHNIKNATPHYLHTLPLERTLVPLTMTATGRSKTPVHIHKCTRCHVVMINDYPRTLTPAIHTYRNPASESCGYLAFPPPNTTKINSYTLCQWDDRSLSWTVGGGEVVRTVCQAEQWESVLTDGEVLADVWTGASCEDLGSWAVRRHILQLHFWGIRMM